MTDNTLVDLHEFRLPRDMAWRVRFVAAVEDHARQLGLRGEFQPPRFFGYYFTGAKPVVIAGHWTVMLDEMPLLRRLREAVDFVTAGQFSIAAAREGAEPAFMLVHDRHDGSCFLWAYEHGRKFLEASEPVAAGPGDEDGKPRLLGN
jgi:hypothetical protein